MQPSAKRFQSGGTIFSDSDRLHRKHEENGKNQIKLRHQQGRYEGRILAIRQKIPDHDVENRLVSSVKVYGKSQHEHLFVLAEIRSLSPCCMRPSVVNIAAMQNDIKEESEMYDNEKARHEPIVNPPVKRGIKKPLRARVEEISNRSLCRIKSNDARKKILMARLAMMNN